MVEKVHYRVIPRSRQTGIRNHLTQPGIHRPQVSHSRTSSTRPPQRSSRHAADQPTIRDWLRCASGCAPWWPLRPLLNNRRMTTMPRIAITGHMNLTPASVPLVYKAIAEALIPIARSSPRLKACATSSSAHIEKRRRFCVAVPLNTTPSEGQITSAVPRSNTLAWRWLSSASRTLPMPPTPERQFLPRPPMACCPRAPSKSLSPWQAA